MDLCILMEQVANQVRYLIEHAQVDGKSVAFAFLDPSPAEEQRHRKVASNEKSN